MFRGLGICLLLLLNISLSFAVNAADNCWNSDTTKIKECVSSKAQASRGCPGGFAIKSNNPDGSTLCQSTTKVNNPDGTPAKNSEAVDTQKTAPQSLYTPKNPYEGLPTLEKRLSQYGERSKTNKENGEVDWKAYSHAFRLIYEWEQLLTEGKLTFPVPNREYILEVKLGKIPFEIVQDKLFTEFDKIKNIPNNLPKPETEFWDNFILKNYGKRQIKRSIQR